MALGEKDWLACCRSNKFAREMEFAGPFSDYEKALTAAKHIWFNKVDLNGWLEAFSAHPQIGETPSKTQTSPTTTQWSERELSTVVATDSTLEELHEWNARYKEKFGFVFVISASGRSIPEILSELKRRYENRPIVEVENAAREQMKITEARLSKVFSMAETGGFTRKLQDESKARSFVLDTLFPALVFFLCMLLMYLAFSLICFIHQEMWDDQLFKFS